MEKESKEELHFSWALTELKDAGHIEWFEEQTPQINLSNSIWGIRTEIKKTKEKREDFQAMQRHIYTPDFLIKWKDTRLMNAFPHYVKGGSPFWGFFNIDDKINYPDGFYSIIEIKPSFDQNNMTRLFKINQKWIYDKHGIYVQLIKPEVFFKNFFTPQRYLFTDKSKQKRKLKFTPTMLNEYLNT